MPALGGGHGEHYYKWAKMGQEQDVLFAGFEFQEYKEFKYVTRYFHTGPERVKVFEWRIMLIAPDGQVYDYKHFGHALNRATKIIKQYKEWQEQGKLIPTLWQEALEMYEKSYKGELRMKAWDLTSFHKYDYM